MDMQGKHEDSAFFISPRSLCLPHFKMSGLYLFSLSFLFLVLSFSSLPAGQENCQNKKADRVKVTVVVILATEDGNFVDKRLQAIAQEVRKLNPQLKSFHLKTMTKQSLAADEKASFALVDNKFALILVKHGADQENRVGLAVTAPNQGEIEYRTVCGKFLPIVTRYQTQARERLILAIRVQPCLGD